MDQSRAEQRPIGETQGQAEAKQSIHPDSVASGDNLESTQQSSFLGSQKPASVQEDHQKEEDGVALPGKLPETPCRGRPQPMEHKIKNALMKFLAGVGAVGAYLIGSRQPAAFLGPASPPVIAPSPPVVPHHIQDVRNPLPPVPEEIEGLE
ncbi:hypothetical protein Emag_005751 [Eimeria magna]